MDYEQIKQDIKDKVDDELVGRIAVGGIVGIPAMQVSREQARRMKPDLSSDNPSRIWSRSQQTAISMTGSMQESLEFYTNILLQAAEAALIDQQGDILESGNVCSWPPSPYAGAWYSWCVNNILNLKKNIEEQVYNLDGYNLWEIGEISTGIIKKRIAVKTTYENGVENKHYYPETNWH